MPKLTDDELRAFLGEMPTRGEDRRGVWAKRYYLPGTRWSDG
jgi:hypothetical protein